MEHGVLIKILEWAWVGLIAVVAWMFKKIWAHDSNIGLLLQAQELTRVQRVEDVERNDKAHDVLTEALKSHNKNVMSRLDALANKHD